MITIFFYLKGFEKVSADIRRVQMALSVLHFSQGDLRRKSAMILGYQECVQLQNRFFVSLYIRQNIIEQRKHNFQFPYIKEIVCMLHQQ